MSEALIFASINPQYDNRLFIELPVQYMKTTSSEHQENMLCTKIVLNVKTKTKLCTQYVLLMFWACSFHLLNWKFNRQSFVILWVSYCKNKCFWKRFTCTENYLSFLNIHSKKPYTYIYVYRKIIEKFF